MSEEAKNEVLSRKVSRRKFVRLATITATALPVAGVLAACTSNPSPTTAPVSSATKTSSAVVTTQAATTAPAVATTAAVAPVATTDAVASDPNLLKSPFPGVPDGYLKSPAMFKSWQAGFPGKGTTVRVFSINYAAPPPPRSENKYWQELEKRLGVTWEPIFTTESTYQEKISVLTASGDLPDLTLVWTGGAPDQFKALQQGAYTDLTPYLTGSALNDYPNLAKFPAQVWKNASFKGKLYGVPRLSLQVGNLMVYRKDWADKLGMSEVKNSEDFLKLMQGFAKNDPDGNAQADTWGLGSDENSFWLNAMIANMFRLPNRWRQETDGSLVSFIEVPEFKEYLAFQRRLWEAGVYHPDSPTMSNAQVRDNFLAGKYGAYTTGPTNLNNRRNDFKKSNPKADVQALIPAGFDAGKAVHWAGPGYFGFAAIPSKVGKDKERVKELLRILDYLNAPFGSEEYSFLSNGIDGIHNEVKPDGSRVRNKLGENESALNAMWNIGKIGSEALYYPTSPENVPIVQDAYKKALEVAVPDPTWVAYSNTYNTKGLELGQFLDDRLSRIVLGRDPLTALDGVIKEWKSRGGTQVAKEYAESLGKA